MKRGKFASSWAFLAVHLRSLLFWDMTLQQWVTGVRRFETTQWSHLQGRKCLKKITTGPLKMRPLRCLVTLGVRHPQMRCYIQEEAKS